MPPASNSRALRSNDPEDAQPDGGNGRDGGRESAEARDHCGRHKAGKGHAEERHREQDSNRKDQDQSEQHWERCAAKAVAEWCKHGQRAQAADGKCGADDGRQVRMRGGKRMAFGAADMQVPVRNGLLRMLMGVAIHAPRPYAPQPDAAKDDQQRPAKHLAAALDRERQRPAERNERACAHGQQQRVSSGKAHGDPKRPGTLRGRCHAAWPERQRRNAHQMIGAEPVEKAKRQGG